ncbi:LOW QUALITY PROTEIN: hypothetical protein ElyMa_005047000 [Elysia marginata]|uniref:Uncharacterized protein n=1 Tax=Elysia marginata TaxID=1093978 RepID=A0AAV4JB49_9GAST|nr:LOW QUALITY PROTEIN: hypothetical protein ElyMa_005047000 [Elysia marginata]
MSSLQILSPNSNRMHSQELLTQRTTRDSKPTLQEQPILLNVSEGSTLVKGSETAETNTLVVSNVLHSSISYGKETNPTKISLRRKADFGQPQSSNDQGSSKLQTSSDRGRPKSSRPNSHRISFSKKPIEPNVRTTESDSATPQSIPLLTNTASSISNKRTSSRLSYFSSTSPEDREDENVNPGLQSTHRTVSCDSLLPRRSRSSQSKYHDGCFPKEDPALIIGSPYRIQSARERRAKSAHKRPTIRHRESVFTIRESVVNLVYTAQSETEQDELGRARAETERDARALRSGALSTGSFSQGFFHQTNRWAYPANRQRRTYTHYNNLHMAGTLGASCEYPTVQEDDCSTGRYTYSRQSCSPRSDDMDGATLSVPGLPVFRPASQRSLALSSRHSDSPQSDTAPSQKASGFLYQMVGFDNLADNVPTFVRQNVKKTGRMQTESFILRLNYLRRRRALGETSSTININAKAKTQVLAASTTAASGSGRDINAKAKTPVLAASTVHGAGTTHSKTGQGDLNDST